MKGEVFSIAAPLLDAEQIKTARVLLRWQPIELAERAEIDVEIVQLIEAGGAVDASVLRAVTIALLDQCIGFSVDGRATLDGFFYNARRQDGSATFLTEKTPPAEECRFRHPPLRHKNHEGWPGV